MNIAPEMPAPGQFFRLSVACRGIKKRARTERGHSFKIGFVPYKANLEAEEIEMIQEEARQTACKEMRAIMGSDLQVSLDHIDNKEDSYIWEPYGDKNKRWTIQV